MKIVMILSLAAATITLSACEAAVVKPLGPSAEEIAALSAKEADLKAEYAKVDSVTEIKAIFSKAAPGSIEKKMSLVRLNEILLADIAKVTNVKEANTLLKMAPPGSDARNAALKKIQELEKKT